MTRWEYITVKITGGDICKPMNDLGEQGWEAIQIQQLIEPPASGVLDPGQPQRPTMALMILFKRFKDRDWLKGISNDTKNIGIRRQSERQDGRPH